MRSPIQGNQHLSAFTITELTVATSVGLLLIAVLVSASVMIQRSLASTDRFSVAANNSGRLIDYVVQDLRRAVGAGMLVAGTNTPLRNNITFAVSEVNTLTINIPDYYASNSQNRDITSPFRISRYPRTDLNTLSTYNGNGAAALNGCVYWKQAVTTVGSTLTTRFAPTTAGTGQVQVRYYRANRSNVDPTPCYFRAEYPSNSNTPNFSPQEVAERIVTNGSTTTLVVAAPDLPAQHANYGRTFTVSSSFTPVYRRSGTSAPTSEQSVTVVMRNPRRD